MFLFWLSFRIQFVILFRKQWLWVIVMIVLGKFCRYCFSQFIDLVLRWLVGLLRSRIFGLFSSRCVKAIWWCFLFESMLMGVLLGGQCRVFIVVLMWLFSFQVFWCLSCFIILFCCLMSLFILLLFMGFENFRLMVLQVLSRLIIFCMFFFIILCIVLFGLSFGFCFSMLILQLLLKLILFLQFLFLFVMILSRVDLLELLRLSILILVLQKKFSQILFRIFLDGGKVLEIFFIEKIIFLLDIGGF